MLEEPKIKKVDKRDKQLPQNFEQLIEMYDVEKIWPYMKKVIDYINNDLEKVAVSPTEPSNKEEVWLQKNKNLFNALTTFASSWSTVTTIENTNNGIMFKGSASTWQYVSFLLDLKAGTYAFKRKWKLTSGTQDNHTGEVNISKKSDSSNLLFLSSSMSDGVFTITEDTTIRIVIYLNRDVALTEETQIEVYDIQLEQGTEATEYTPYVENKILTKNSDGEYEDFMKESVVISPTEPTINRKDVWIKRGNNIFKDSLIYGLGNLKYENGIATQITADTNQNPNWKLQAYNNWNYVTTLKTFYPAIGKNSYTFIKRSNFNVLQLAVNGSTIDTAIYIDISNLTNDETYTISFNVLNAKQGSISWNEIQIERGSKATNYTPYIEKKIYCRNDIGEYEEFVNAETMGIETITNSNGTAIKYPDGTMICCGPINVPENTGELDVSFPMNFKDTTIYINITNYYAYLKRIMWSYCIRTKQYFTAFPLDISTNNVPSTKSLGRYMAIGRWK